MRVVIYLMMTLFIITGCSENVVASINLPPQVSILSHSDGDRLNLNEESVVDATRKGNKTMSELVAIWYLDGEVLCPFDRVTPDGLSRCYGTLPQGEHTVRIEVLDNDGGRADDAVELVVFDTVCDGSPGWTDPYDDGSLRLFEDETFGFDTSVQTHSFACVQDKAQINICESEATLSLNGDSATTVGGNGLVPLNGQDVTLMIESTGTEPLFFLVDCTVSCFTVSVHAPYADVTLTSKGEQLLQVDTVNSGGFTVWASGPFDLIGPLNAAGDVNIDSAGGIVLGGPIVATGSLTVGAGSADGQPLESPECL